MPTFFEPNAGQAASDSRFVGRAGGRAIHLGDDGAWAQVAPPLDLAPAKFDALPPEAVERGRIGFRFLGATPGSTVAVDPLTSRSNHFLGSEPAAWRTRLPNFRRLLRRGLYDGIDLEWVARDSAFEYRFTVAPRADPSRIRMRWPQGARPAIAADGRLVVESRDGRMSHSRPVAFQHAGAGERRVPIEFALGADGQVGFRVGDFDRTRALVIDPFIDYASYYGSPGTDEDTIKFAVDPSGSPYIAGRVPLGGSVPATASAFQKTFGGGGIDAFVCKFDATTLAPVFTSYLGGSGDEEARGFTVDADGSAILVGYTTSTNFPVQSALYGSKISSSFDMFVTKFSPDGSSLVFSTYYGGSQHNSGALGAAVDEAGDIYVCGNTQANNFPLVNALFSTYRSSFDGVLVKLKGDGSEVLLSTYIAGGNAFDNAAAIRVNTSGELFVLGHTESTDLPVRNAAQTTRSGDLEVWIMKINADATDYDYLTYLGGTGRDDVADLEVDDSGRAHVYGHTRSTNFPLVNALDSVHAGTDEVFYTVLSADGDTFEYSTYLGGTGTEQAGQISLMPDGSRILTGMTGSSAFPTVLPVQPTYGGGTTDGFVARLAADGASLRFSSFLGGSGDDFVRGVAVVGDRLILAGETKSSNFPLQSPNLSQNDAGKSAAFLARISLDVRDPTTLEAVLTDLTVAGITWQDNANDEIEVQLERRALGESFALLATLPPDADSYSDETLERGKTYFYRLRVASAEFVSEYTNEASVQSPPLPQFPPGPPPSNLSVVLNPDGHPSLTWQDNSPDEEQFQINRSVAGGAFSIRASVISGTTSFTDTQVLPDRTYSYGVRAVNLVGTSSFTSPASVITPPSLDIALTKGLISDSTRFGRDRVVVRSTIAVNTASPDGAWDPVADGIQVRLGGESQAPLFTLGPADEGWIARRNGKMFWKSPRGSISKAKILYDPATGALSITLTKLNFVTPPANPVLLWLGGADDAGHFEGDWFLRRPGLLKYPVPVPK